MSRDISRENAASELSAGLGLAPIQASMEVEHMAKAVSGKPQKLFDDMVEARLSGKPLEHIIGTSEFMDLEIACGPDVLVPRPETETLVETVLRHVQDAPIVIGDLGSGSGAIAATLASSLPSATVVACEVSPKACAIANANFSRLNLNNVQIVDKDWQELDMQFDLLVSNPPYVTTALCERMARQDNMHDPQLALDGGKDGLGSIRSVLKVAGRNLREHGRIFLEHGVGQHLAVCAIAAKSGLEVTGSHRDLQGLRRIVQATSKA